MYVPPPNQKRTYNKENPKHISKTDFSTSLPSVASPANLETRTFDTESNPRMPSRPELFPNSKTVGREAVSVRKNTIEQNSDDEPISPSLKTKDQLIEKIKEWVKIDNDIRVLQKEINKRRLDKKKVSTELMEVMRTNDIDAFDIKDGQIIYDKRNAKKPITKSALLSILSSYFNGDVLKANEINNYILENREEVVKERIVRKINGNQTKPNSGIV